MRCSDCNNDVTVPGANFCPDCGTPLGRVSPGEGFHTYAYIGFGPKKGRSSYESRTELTNALENAEKICRRYGAVAERDSRNGLIAKFPDNAGRQSSAELAAFAALEIKEYYRRTDADDFGSTGFSVGIDGGPSETGVSAGEIIPDDLPLEGARRLFAKAPPNTVLISGSIAGRIETSFLFKALGFYRLRARKDALRIFELLERKASYSGLFETQQEHPAAGRRKK